MAGTVKADKRELFERTPIPKALASLAVPTIISQLINLIYNVVDTFFIGRTGNAYMMAAVTVAFPIFMMTIAFANLFGIGGGSLVARLIGRRETERAEAVSAYSFWGAVLISLAYSLVIGLFAKPVLRVLGASEQTIGFALHYVYPVVVIGSVPVILSGALAHLLRNVGQSRRASAGLSGGGILNIVLDPLFMFVLLPKGYEVLGAAIATLTANVGACLFLLWSYRREAGAAPLRLSPKAARRLLPEDRRELFAVGVPSALLPGLFDVGSIFLNKLMSAHGDIALAAIGIVIKAERLPNAMNIGISQGMLPLVAYNFASGNRERMREALRTARTWGLTVSGISIVLFEIFAGPISRLFMNTSSEGAAAAAATIAFAGTFLRIRVLASPLQFINYNSSYCMQAMGDGKSTLLHAVVRELVFYVPFMFLLDRLFGEYGLAAALIAGEACGAAFALFLVHRMLKRREAGAGAR